MICGSLDYTRQGYRKHEKRLLEKRLNEVEILKEVKQIKCIMPKIGARKMKTMLSEKSLHIGRDHLFQLLSVNGLLVKKKNRKKYLSSSTNINKSYNNLLKNLVINRVDQVWVCDITYIRLLNKFCYLYLVTDYYSRKIVGYCVSDNLKAKNCLVALKMALKGAKNTKEIIHHSDHGVQYISHDYTEYLINKGFKISYTGENHCYDNAVAERVNNTLKHEFGLANVFKSIGIFKEACIDSINIYNNYRPHNALNSNVPENVYNSNIVDNLCS